MAAEHLKLSTLATDRLHTITTPLTDFDNIADRSPGLIDVYNHTTQQYVYVNNSIKYILGINPEDMLNGGLQYFISRIHPDDLEASAIQNEIASKAVEKLTPEIDDSIPFASFEYRVRHANGDWVWLHTDASVFSRTPDGILEYIVNTCVNITNQKAYEDKLRHTTKELQVSQRALQAEHDQLIALNVAKDEFVSIASHQLRMPATGVKQYIGLLLQGYAGELTDAQLTILRAAFDSNERQLDIITNLLSTSRLDAGKVQPHKKRSNLTDLVQQVTAELQEKFQSRKQKIAFEHRDKPVHVNVDERLLLMVIENLLDNASKYSPEGTTIDIKLKATKQAAVLDITDHGYGIPKAHQEELFKKFSRIENPLTEHIAGTGLGLYWAKKVVDLHHGNIKLKSSTKKGSTFEVSLPHHHI